MRAGSEVPGDEKEVQKVPTSLRADDEEGGAATGREGALPEAGARQGPDADTPPLDPVPGQRGKVPTKRSLRRATS